MFLFSLQTKYPKNNKPAEFGFSLIELIVVTLIIITLTSLGIAGYNTFNQTQILKQAAAGVESALRDAQNRALAGEKDCTACPGNDGICNNSDDLTLVSWRFEVTGAQSYRILGKCGSQDFGIKNYTLSPILTIVAPNKIVFNPISFGATLGTVTITHNGYTPKKTITVAVTTSGQITVGDIQQ